MGFSRLEYWSGLPFPTPENPPVAGIEPGSPTLHTDSLLSELPGIIRLLITISSNKTNLNAFEIRKLVWSLKLS